MDRPDERLVAEFTHQAESFNKSPVMNMQQTTGSLIALLPLAPGQRWLEVASGPGILSRALAPQVASVTGVDLTPAMVALAGREAAGLANLNFQVGDATALPLAAGSFDGAVTRFSLHHMPEPGRCVAEMARVVGPGGWVAVADHLTSEDSATAAWHQDIERLRDPSHVLCLTPPALRRMAAAAGLKPVAEHVEPLIIDYDEWIGRGSGGPANRARIEAALSARPHDACFAVQPGPSGRRLQLTFGRFLWRKATAARLQL